jgi:hypothetical protein
MITKQEIESWKCFGANAMGFKWERKGKSSKHIPFDWSGPILNPLAISFSVDISLVPYPEWLVS